MSDMEKLFSDLAEQEENLKFINFTHADALEIGLLINKEAQKRGVIVAIEITIAGQAVFRYSPDGATPNNDLWLVRKHNMVNIRSMSSLRAFAMLKLRGQDLERDWLLDPKDYAACGGGFPINIKGVGIIGSICVSGLPHFDDHNLIVDVLSEFSGVNISKIM